MRPQSWQHPNDVYAWQGLKIARFFASFQRCYLKLPWYKLHTSQVADFQIWDTALSDDELLKVIAIILFCKNDIVGSKHRIVTHWRTLHENQPLGQYFSIFQWSKEYNGSPTFQTIFCTEKKISTLLLHFYADGRMWSFLHIFPWTKSNKNAKKHKCPQDA